MKLDAYMSKNRLKLKDFSEATGLSMGYISRIKTGRLPASRDAIIAIHRATNGKVSFTDLVGDELVEV